MDKAPVEIKDKVNFICYKEDGSIPLPSGSLDIICSKGVLTYVKNKRALFKEFFRLLNPSGEIFLVDWLVPEEQESRHEMLPLGEMAFKETESFYHKILRDCGFRNIRFKNKSVEYLGYVKNLILKLDSREHRDNFSEIIEPSFREKIIQAELKLQTSIERKEQFSVLIRANI